MDRYVKNFIIMSIIYLAVASLFGILMVYSPEMLFLRYIHSHLMLLGFVTMMIFGVGYHILPRFSGKLIQNKALCEFQFYLSNIGLIGLVIFYSIAQYGSGGSFIRTLAVLSGIMEVFSFFLFLYIMLKILLSKSES